MNKETKHQMIYESFDVLKDSWEDSREAIIRLIYNMFSINQSVAIKMWLYVLNKNKKNLTDYSASYKSTQLTENIVTALVYGPNCGCYYLDFDKPSEITVANIIFQDKELYTYIFGKSITIGDHTIRLLSHLIASNDSQTLLSVLNLIKKNKKDKSIGEILTIAIDHISHASAPVIPANQIEFLEYFVSQLENKKDKAEAFTALLSLE